MVTIHNVKKYEDYIINWRRDLHMHPEPGFKEVRTSLKIKEELEKLGCEVISGVGTTGIVATLKGNKPGKTILLRADIDALKMQEENDVPYKSVYEGYMHACGHDAHSAMLLGAVKYFSEHQDFPGKIKFVFQAAEEGPMPGGGYYVVNDGHIDDVDAVFALHITTAYESGVFAIKKGPALAAPDEFRIKIIGKGTHASSPESGNDPIIASSAVISAIQTILSRKINPLSQAVITVSTIHGGTAFNIIPDVVEMSGTIRTLDKDIRKEIFLLLKKTVKDVSSAYGCIGETEIIEAYPPLINDEQMSDFALNIAKKIVGEENVLINKNPSMGGEDFAYYLEKKKGAFMWLGGRDKKTNEIYYNHSPKFDIDESALIIGTMYHINIAKTFLSQNKKA